LVDWERIHEEKKLSWNWGETIEDLIFINGRKKHALGKNFKWQN